MEKMCRVQKGVKIALYKTPQMSISEQRCECTYCRERRADGTTSDYRGWSDFGPFSGTRWRVQCSRLDPKRWIGLGYNGPRDRSCQLLIGWQNLHAAVPLVVSRLLCISRVKRQNPVSPLLLRIKKTTNKQKPRFWQSALDNNVL